MSKDLVFIASGGRTGTQFLGRTLSAVIADCHSEHEPDMLEGLNRRTLEQMAVFGFWYMLPGRLLGQTGVRSLGHRLMTGSLDADTVRRRLVASRRRYHATIPQSLVVESHCQWWFLAHELANIWPEAKLVGIVRDPRTWVRSWRNRDCRHVGSDIVQYFPPGRLTPAALGEEDWAKRWPDMDSFGRLAWEWRTVNGHLSRSIARAPHARLYRFEDLFGPDPQPMNDLVGFVATHGGRNYQIGDIDAHRDTVANASPDRTPHWQDWTQKDARLLDELCGPLMREFGYGNEPEWLEMLEPAPLRKAG